MRRVRGVLWRGRSKINGEPIAVVATEGNAKLGAMVQLWIVPLTGDVIQTRRESDTGTIKSVCGDCPMGTASYVLPLGPQVIVKALQDGNYPDIPFAALKGRKVRIGAWGDPGAVPGKVWSQVKAEALGTTSYTHRHRAVSLKAVSMASCESLEQAARMEARGWRTYTVLPAGAPMPEGRVLCPASKEAGERTTCADCLLCDGKRGANDARRNVVVYAHGTSARILSNKLSMVV